LEWINCNYRPMDRQELNKELLNLYETVLKDIKGNFDLDVTIGDDLTKKNMKEKYTQAVLSDLLLQGKSILCLIENKLSQPANLHSRKLLETYLQTRLIMTIDTKAAFLSFWAFEDYSSYIYLKKIVNKKNIVKEGLSKLLKEKITNYENQNTKKRYLDSLETVKTDFKKAFPEIEKNQYPSKNDVWWLGYGSKKTAEIFPDGALEIYSKLYRNISIDAHPSPGGYYNIIITEETKSGKSNSALILGINMTIWTIQLLTDEDELKKLFKNHLDSLSTTLLNFYGEE
jgi:hypothetical protein